MMKKNRWPVVLVMAIAGLITLGCAHPPVAPTAEVRQTLAPTGTLRLGLLAGTPGQMIGDPATGNARGVAFELGRELARRLGIPYEVVVLKGNAQFVEALRSGRVDFASNNATAARAEHMAFAQPHLEVEAGFLVPPGSPISSIEGADRAGIRIGVTQGSTSEARFAAELKHATLVRVPALDIAARMLGEGKLDAYATNKANLFQMADNLPGFRVLDGRYGVEQISIAIPKGRELAMPFLRQFIADVKSEGLVASAANRAGLRGYVKDRE